MESIESITPKSILIDEAGTTDYCLENKDVSSEPVLIENETSTESGEIFQSISQSRTLSSVPICQKDCLIGAPISDVKIKIDNKNEDENFYQQISQLRAALIQKDNVIKLYEREKNILEMEKSALQKEKDAINKEKENIVIKFATQEKSILDGKKEKDIITKQLNDTKKEMKFLYTRFQAINEEKSRIAYMMEEKCNETKKSYKEIEKLKSDINNLELKLKWNTVKLNQETENKLAAEKKLEDEKSTPKQQLLEEKANEKRKMEYQATLILLKHELEKIEKINENFKKEQKETTDKIYNLQESLNNEIKEKNLLSDELEKLVTEHATVQHALSQEILHSAKLRGQLDELQILRTQNTINEEKISGLHSTIVDLQQELEDNTCELTGLREKEFEILQSNKEMSEMIADLQNQICLSSSKAQAYQAENELLNKEKSDFNQKYSDIKDALNNEIQKKNEERVLLTQHLSEKTKSVEIYKLKLDNALGELEATKKKTSQIVKELQRELNKYKKQDEESSRLSIPENKNLFCQKCMHSENGIGLSSGSGSQDKVDERANASRSSSFQSDSESDIQSQSSVITNENSEPSTQHLINRILRLQQASVRQTEKIDFLENHTMSLVSELKKKTKLVHYYMLRDQAGALTSSKSDQHKSEFSKYGGVMSAIYSGIKGPSNQSMTLELSLEINKKLQAVLEDTILKNITLKENLDILGLQVEKLTHPLAQRQTK